MQFDMTSIPQEGDLLSENQDEQVKETPAAPSAEQKPEEEAASPEAAKPDSPASENTQEDKNLPFHKHPRWLEREKEWNDRLNSLEQTYEEKLAETQSQLLSKLSPATPQQIPAWFKGIYGEDPQAWADYQNYTKADREQLKQELRAEVEAKTREEQKLASEGQKWIDKQIFQLRGEGLEFNEQELLATALKYSPSDEDGNYDLRKAYELLQLQKKAPAVNPEASKARKELAASTSSPSGGDSSSRKVATTQNIRYKSWDNLTDD